MIALDNVMKCSTCGKTIVADEEFTHKCQFDLVDIPVSDVFIRMNDDQESAIGHGLNGKYYRLLKKLKTSPEMKRSRIYPEDETDPKNRICILGRRIKQLLEWKL